MCSNGYSIKMFLEILLKVAINFTIDTFYPLHFFQRDIYKAVFLPNELFHLLRSGQSGRPLSGQSLTTPQRQSRRTDRPACDEWSYIAALQWPAPKELNEGWLAANRPHNSWPKQIIFFYTLSLRSKLFHEIYSLVFPCSVLTLQPYMDQPSRVSRHFFF